MEDMPSRNIRIYSWLFVALAAWDLISIAINFLAGDLDVVSIAAGNNFSESIVLGVVIAIVAIVVIFALLKLLIGLKGFKIAAGSRNVTGINPLLIIILVVEIIGLIIYIGGFFTGNPNYPRFFGTIATIAVIVDFLANIKKIKNSSV